MQAVRIQLLALHEQTGCITLTKLVWTMVILNGSEVNELLQTLRHFKCIKLGGA